MNYRTLLAAGVAVPFVYFGGQIVALLLNPGYDIASQQPSELGCCNATFPMVANAAFVATGCAAVLGGVGLFAGLRAIGGNFILAVGAGLGLALFGVAMAMSGLFPLPHPFHYGFGLLFAGLLAPLFGALALRDGGAARVLILAGLVLSLAIVALQMGVGGMVTRANAGWFSRFLALAAFSTVGFLCWTVLRRTRPVR